MDWISTLLKALLILPQLFFAVVLHEMAHGYTAEKLGDNTARNMGRITLNPLKHIDPFMTILLPLMLFLAHSPVVFGGAKPVPVNPMNFRRPRQDMAIVAIAGPVMNLFIACGYLVALWVVKMFENGSEQGWIAYAFVFLLYGFTMNIFLAVFNLIPVPPLDGGRILVGVLPLSIARCWAKLERFGIFLVFIILYSGILDKPFMYTLQGSRKILEIVLG